MTATPNRKPVTLDDLDRDELLRFTRSRVWGYNERDLLWAQWEVATDRAQRASAEVLAAYDELAVAAKTLDSAMHAVRENDPYRNLKAAERALKDLEKARDNYLRLRDEQGKREAKVARFDRRADHLYRLYRELPR